MLMPIDSSPMIFIIHNYSAAILTSSFSFGNDSLKFGHLLDGECEMDQMGSKDAELKHH
jgi:hypothetical protein